MTERLMYPGYRTSAGPTFDWPASAGATDAFAWYAYGPPDDDGISERASGFRPTMDSALRAADAALLQMSDPANLARVEDWGPADTGVRDDPS